MTRVSIITPFLNAGPFIERIKSVLAQTYDNWELLLLDDGSTDASTGIALKCAAAHADKVRCLSHERRQNRGASASRNLAAATREENTWRFSTQTTSTCRTEARGAGADSRRTPGRRDAVCGHGYWYAAGAGVGRTPVATGCGAGAARSRTR